MSERPALSWSIVKTFTVRDCMVEVSKSDSHQDRYSFRVTWTDGTKKGPWFPDRGISFVEHVLDTMTQAEAWILEEQDKVLKVREAAIAERRAKEDDKRKRHNDNLEARRVNDRARTARSKGARQ